MRRHVQSIRKSVFSGFDRAYTRDFGAPPTSTTTDQDRERLLQRPVDEDTRILSAKYFRANGIPFVLEKWSFDGIYGMTAVFLTEHVSAMDAAALNEFVTSQGVESGGGTTIVRRADFTFLNFGFEAT
jgi:hypothetical protein